MVVKITTKHNINCILMGDFRCEILYRYVYIKVVLQK